MSKHVKGITRIHGDHRAKGSAHLALWLTQPFRVLALAPGDRGGLHKHTTVLHYQQGGARQLQSTMRFTQLGFGAVLGCVRRTEPRPCNANSRERHRSTLLPTSRACTVRNRTSLRFGG
jgi:hypothetical protein